MTGTTERSQPDGTAPDGEIRLTLQDEAATQRLGAALAALLGPGDCVTLSGPLGAGKSALARAIVRSVLAEPEREVPSPSYTLVNLHEPEDRDSAGFPIWHADLYRLSGAEEAAELGLWEALDTAMVLIEWPERLEGRLPSRRVEIVLSLPEGLEEDMPESARRVILRPVGPGWERLRDLAGWPA